MKQTFSFVLSTPDFYSLTKRFGFERVFSENDVSIMESKDDQLYFFAVTHPDVTNTIVVTNKEVSSIVREMFSVNDVFFNVTSKRI